MKFINLPTLIVLRSKHGPLCPLDLTTKSPVDRAAEIIGQMCEAPCKISSNSTLVTSFSAGHSLAHNITAVPLSNNALTNGKIPRTISTPLLSTNTAAQWWTVFCNNEVHFLNNGSLMFFTLSLPLTLIHYIDVKIGWSYLQFIKPFV